MCVAALDQLKPTRTYQIRTKLTSSLSSPTCSLNAILRQLTWILWESDQLGVEGNQASAPAGWGAILRAWLQRCSSARNAASQQCACCYPRTTVSLSGSAVPREDTLPCVRVFIWADACHCVPATNSYWHVIYLKLPLLLVVRREDECFKSACVLAKWQFNPPPSFTSGGLLHWWNKSWTFRGHS